jgi:hypothetical protein
LATFPERLFAAVNAGLVATTDALLAPLLVLPPLVQLLLLSLVTAAPIVLVIARTTDQHRVRQTKRLIQAALFEIRLFNDDPRTVFRSIGDALRHNLTYVRLSLVPLALLAAPLMLAVTHLNAFYGYGGLHVGTPALLEIELRANDVDTGAISLQVPDIITTESGPVQLLGERRLLWRIRPVSAGDSVLTIRIGDEKIPKTVRVSARPGRRSPARMTSGIVAQYLHPSEAPLEPGSSVSSVRVTYPVTDVDVAGFAVHWTLVYAALTFASAVILARIIGVTL